MFSCRVEDGNRGLNLSEQEKRSTIMLPGFLASVACKFSFSFSELNLFLTKLACII